jgi:hypothetical protein
VLDLRPDQLAAAPQIRNNQMQMLQNPQFLEQARNFYQVRTYTAASPIETPSLPAAASAPCPPVLPLLPPPCACFGNPYCDWPQSLLDFSSE